MRLVEHAEGEPPLPQGTAPLLAEIDSPRIAPMRPADGPSQAVRRLRHRDQVHVFCETQHNTRLGIRQ
jgi:hypothetical protein